MLGTAIAMLCMLGLSQASAAGVQDERGYVATPLVGRAGGIWVEGCPGVVDASLRWAARQSILYNFSVASSTWGRPFSLTSKLNTSNLDISFRAGPGSGWVRYASKGLRPEYGIVPNGAVEAVICLSGGAPARFVYLAG